MKYRSADSSAWPLMMSGVRASSMRMLSTSSTIGEEALALDPLVELDDHVVAQVVEAELVVRAVRDVGGVGLLAGDRAQVDEALVGRREARFEDVRRVVGDHPDADAEEVEDRTHPLRVAPGQVVVDRHDVHAAAGHRVEDRGKRRDEGLALAGAHLGDAALVQDGAADELDVEVAHLRGFASSPRGSSRRPRGARRRGPSGGGRSPPCGGPSSARAGARGRGGASSSSDGSLSRATSRTSARISPNWARICSSDRPSNSASRPLASSTHGWMRRISRSFESTNLEKNRMGREVYGQTGGSPLGGGGEPVSSRSPSRSPRRGSRTSRHPGPARTARSGPSRSGSSPGS